MQLRYYTQLYANNDRIARLVNPCEYDFLISKEWNKIKRHENVLTDKVTNKQFFFVVVAVKEKKKRLI